MPFCIQCGKELSGEEKYCPTCGHVVVSASSEQKAFCYSCGENVTRDTPTCPRCGTDLSGAFTSREQTVVYSTTPVREKDPMLGVIFSILIVGLGTIYAGYVERGLGLLIGCVVTAFLAVLFFPIAIANVVIWIYGIYDAYEKCNEANRVH